jgi:protoheme IX farnesyltransferase
MSQSRTLAATTAQVRDPGRVADLLALTKPRVVLMILVTTLVGFYLGEGNLADPWPLLALLVGTALAAGGTLALNQYLERDVDACMARTCQRPLPSGRMRPGGALAFGTALVVLGLAILGAAVSPTSCLVTAFIAGSYLFAYTPLKRHSPLCILVGAVPGALPPVTGWVAARGDIGTGAWVLFGLLFLWQLPHTLAIATLHGRDYAQAGLRLSEPEDADGTRTGRRAVADCMALLLMGVVPALCGMAGPFYLVGAVVLGSALVSCAMGLAENRSLADARRLLFATIVYLPALLTLLALDKIPS